MLADLSDLDFENIGSWPMSIKIGAAVLLFVLILTLGYGLDTRSQSRVQKKLERRHVTLRKDFETMQAKAVNLEKYEAQLAQIKKIFSTMASHLPEETQVPQLVEDISQVGRQSGLEFKLIKPLPEVREDFYAELPVQITVIGGYHQLATFASKLASLTRIVSVGDFSVRYIVPRDGESRLMTGSGDRLLIMELTAKTFRYTGEEQNEQG